MSSPEISAERNRVDTLAGLMSATAIVLGFIAATDLHLSLGGEQVVARPARIGIGAVVLALVAAGLSGRNKRLAAIAVGVAGAGWLIGMIVAVVTERPLF